MAAPSDLRERGGSIWARRASFCGYLVTLVIVAGASAELAARIQDWLTDDVALGATQDWDRDLFLDTPDGRRGRPNGRYKKWVLNEHGFRSAPIIVAPPEGTTRIIVLGASESFGLHESPNHEFPARIGDLLRTHGRFEVVNAALTGLTLKSTLRYWDSWVRRFQPAIVVIYPSPFFYLNESVAPPPPARLRSAAATPPLTLAGRLLGLAAESRMTSRMRDLFDVPDTIQRWRDDQSIRAATSGRPADWLFQSPPQDRIDMFSADLEALGLAMMRDGVRPVVMTHASRVLDPPRPGDMRWLESARVHTPRALPGVIARFETLTNEAIREWARRHDVKVVDIAALCRGRGELFGDLIHFNDAGAGVVARAVADAVLDLTPADPGAPAR